jgi:hypothetical protein
MHFFYFYFPAPYSSPAWPAHSASSSVVTNTAVRSWERLIICHLVPSSLLSSDQR